ncbi:MAG: transcription antitermination factor NusB [Candidatus Pelagibacterales bacterium]
MSNIKSFQRLLVVQALYESSINENRSQTPIKEIFANIVEQSDYKKKMNNTNLNFAEKIYEGVMENLDDINKILKVSTSKKVKINNMDKLLISIFRSAIYEIIFSNNVTKKIVISEYLLIANRFFGNNETAFINGVLDNLQNS